MSKIKTSSEHAEKIWNWLKERGGIAVWNSINLSNPSGSWFTPVNDEHGNKYGKPNWQCSNEPSQIITSADDIEISVDKEVKRFHVAVRQSSNGMMLKLTDSSSEHVRKAVDKAGEGAYHVFHYGDYKNCVIMAPVSSQTLTEWAKENGKV